MTEVLADSRWYAARTKAGQEQIAVQNLRRQNIVETTYYPRAIVERVYRGRLIEESVPVFPGYLLLRITQERAVWRQINSTTGIIRLIGATSDGPPTPLRVGEIERLQQRENAGELKIYRPGTIKRGDKVRVRFGFAVDAIGTVIWRRKERVEFLLNLLGREIRAIAPAHTLQVVVDP